MAHYSEYCFARFFDDVDRVTLLYLISTSPSDAINPLITYDFILELKKKTMLNIFLN